MATLSGGEGDPSDLRDDRRPAVLAPRRVRLSTQIRLVVEAVFMAALWRPTGLLAGGELRFSAFSRKGRRLVDRSGRRYADTRAAGPNRWHLRAFRGLHVAHARIRCGYGDVPDQ